MHLSASQVGFYSIPPSLLTACGCFLSSGQRGSETLCTLTNDGTLFGNGCERFALSARHTLSFVLLQLVLCDNHRQDLLCFLLY